jgi:hypothetical protein
VIGDDLPQNLCAFDAVHASHSRRLSWPRRETIEGGSPSLSADQV